MAFDSNIKFYLTNEDSTLYYSATIDEFGSWHVGSSPAVHDIDLPDGWTDISLMWDREPQYLGIFRKQGQGFKFSGEGRAIILDTYFTQGGSEAELKLTIAELQTDFTYLTAYDCFINFVDLANQFIGSETIGEQKGQLQVTTIDSRIYKNLSAWGGTKFNIPLWNFLGGTAWNTDGKWILHDGIKLLYSANYTSSASPNSPLVMGIFGNSNGDDILGAHTLPAMNSYNITQNNGTTTFVGNDILQPFLIQGTQPFHLNEISFTGVNDSRPGTRAQFCLENILHYGATGVDPIDMDVNIQLTLKTVNCDAVLIPFHLAAVIYEIDMFTDVCTSYTPPGHTRYIAMEIGRIEFPYGCFVTPLSHVSAMQLAYGAPFDTLDPFVGDATHAPSKLNATVNLQLKYQKCYVFSLLLDNTPPGAGSAFSGMGYSHNTLNVTITDMRLNFFSRYNSGTSSVVYDAPIFPPSPVMGFNLSTLWQKLVPCLNSVSSDNYGFPIIPVGTTFTGESTFLSTSATDVDSDPTTVLWTSGNALRLIEGQPYITVSVNDFFSVCKGVYGCGLSIEGDAIRIEKYETFFNASSMIYDLKDNVADLKWTDWRNDKCSSIKSGYPTQQINNDFGVDSFNREQNYTTPLLAYPETLDLSSPIITDEFAIEKARQQQGANTPSASNENVLLQYIDTSVPYAFTAYNPSRIAVPTVTYSYPQKYYGAQATDPTASLAPYIAGKYYPETALNIPLSPSRNLIRNGSLLRSILDLQDGKNITFRNQYQLLFDNSSVPIPGISSNVVVGGAATPFVELFNEVADIPVNNLPNKLFRPFVLSVLTATPVNLYNLMNTNPYGYIQLTWAGRIYKGFVLSITQKLGNNAPTTIELICHPSTTNADLMAI